MGQDEAVDNGGQEHQPGTCPDAGDTEVVRLVVVGSGLGSPVKGRFTPGLAVDQGTAQQPRQAGSRPGVLGWPSARRT